MNHSLIIDEVGPSSRRKLVTLGRTIFLFHRHCRLRRAIRLRSSLAQRNGRPGESDAVNRPDLRDYRATGATADLHQTARVWHFYAIRRHGPGCSWGALFLPLFTGFLGLWFLSRDANG